MNIHRSKIKAPISNLKSPDLDVIPGHSCRKRAKGETPFFSKSKQGFSFLDVGPGGAQTLKSYLNSGKSKNTSGKIKSLKGQFVNRGKISNNPDLKSKLIEKFEVTIKNGEVTSIRRVVNPDGSKITAKSGGKYIPKSELPGYSLKIIGLDGKPDGVYEI
jgi:hypothetical protein